MVEYIQDFKAACRAHERTLESYKILRWHRLLIAAIYLPGVLVFLRMGYELSHWFGTVAGWILAGWVYFKYEAGLTEFLEDTLMRIWPKKPEPPAPPHVDAYAEFLRTHAPHGSPRKR